ncbi:Tfp pilus assembly protein FimT/FimU [Synechococcus sp. UW179A]|uniref:pilus assembly FimT family protein n=1 Tax=Synechococcus sp. UW179A TaxID=2575510 RepID=UPI000E0E8476|nr:prepilin-type N-terminal cleavage/methylation domain-containing protein [Synechococcus sp. UW179A]
MKRLVITQNQTGFSLAELLITLTIFGILSSIALVNLSSSWTKNRLLATTRDLENWISGQRRYAMTHNLSCQVLIDQDNKRLVSTISSSRGTDPCSVDTTQTSETVFDLNTNFGADNQSLTLTTNLSGQPETDAGICFSFRGFSEEFIGECADNQTQNSNGMLEIKLAHSDTNEARCIRIVSPIGMIRDGKSQDSSSECRYDTAY